MPQATILVVEDDPAVMGVVRTTLETDYTVLEAESASRALEISNRISIEIQLVVVDQTLGDGSGHEVVNQLKSIRPNVRVLYFSGYDRARLLDSGVPRDAAILHKPFRPSQLRAVVAGLLQQPQRSATSKETL
jgi:two-component system cell cycle sensor histidine kinase/response regulator CckA